jgi:hypothetical protein
MKPKGPIVGSDRLFQESKSLLPALDKKFDFRIEERENPKEASRNGNAYVVEKIHLMLK